MKHPFQVGEFYQNRQGRYCVLSIKEPFMTVCFDDGRQLQGQITTFARIWENMQAEQIFASTTHTEKARLARGTGRTRLRGAQFTGLKDGDFQRGVTGTTWRARSYLGGLLAQRLSDTTGTPYQSFSVYRRAEVHIARPEHYNETMRVRQAKFIFALTPEEARFGFYVERNWGEMDETWDWLRFMAALRLEANWLRQIPQAMSRYGLVGEAVLFTREGAEETAGRFVVEDGNLVWHAQDSLAPSPVTWAQVAERLAAMPAEKWCDLYLWAKLGRSQAEDEGVGIADRAAAVYKTLVPLYAACAK